MTSSPTDRIDRRALLRLGAAATGALALPASLRAQSAWPSKAIRFVVPFAPGGSSEIIARATAAEMQKILGQSVFVDNRPGGAGNASASKLDVDSLARLAGHLPLDAQTQEILGVPVKKVVIPVAAGRNLAVLLEAAVRNTILQLRGIDTYQEFVMRHRRAMESGESF